MSGNQAIFSRSESDEVTDTSSVQILLDPPSRHKTRRRQLFIGTIVVATLILIIVLCFLNIYPTSTNRPITSNDETSNNNFSSVPIISTQSSSIGELKYFIKSIISIYRII